MPDTPNALLGPWVIPRPIEQLAIVDGCELGDGVRFVPKDGSVPGGAFAGLEISRPTGIRSAVTFVSAIVWYAARLNGSGPTLYFHVDDRRSDGDGRRPLVLGGPSVSENMKTEIQLSSTTTSVYASVVCGPLDGPVPSEACVPSAGVPVVIWGIEFTLREDALPIVTRPTGTLLEDRVQSGIQTLTYSASDAQSGLAKVDVLLGDTVVASRDLTPRCSYSDFTACPTAQDDTLQVDTRGVANGSHRLVLRVTDAAGNERVVNVADRVDVINAPDVGTPDASAFTLAAQFKGSSQATLTVPYGRRVSIRGRLMQGSQPSAGARIDALKTLDRRGAREVSAGHITTGTDGSFTLALPTTRPSRSMRLVYRPSAGRAVVSRRLKLRVRAASRLSASLRGRIVRFNGRVLSGPMVKGGKRVRMEGRSPGSAWTPFKNLRTDSKGRFAGTYRLRVRRPGVVLKVRAYVPSETGYGYLGSRSRAVTLRVR